MKTWCVYTVRYYSVIKNEIWSFAGKLVELEIIMLSETSQIQANITCFLSYMKSTERKRENLKVEEKVSEKRKEVRGEEWKKGKEGNEGGNDPSMLHHDKYAQWSPLFCKINIHYTKKCHCKTITKRHQHRTLNEHLPTTTWVAHTWHGLVAAEAMKGTKNLGGSTSPSHSSPVAYMLISYVKLQIKSGCWQEVLKSKTITEIQFPIALI